MTGGRTGLYESRARFSCIPTRGVCSSPVQYGLYIASLHSEVSVPLLLPERVRESPHEPGCLLRCGKRNYI